MSDGASLPVAIDEQTIIRRSDALLVAPVGEEMIMTNLEKDHYYGLDDIGSEIWRRLETPCTFGVLVDGLAADYDADRAVIASDVRKLLSEMAAQNVVTLG